MKTSTKEKFKQLQTTLKNLESCAIAYSGGVDSTLLVKVAYDVLGKNALAVTAVSSTYPRHEVQDAKRYARQIGIPHIVIHSKEVDINAFSSNPPNRCYYCKRELFRTIQSIANERHLRYIVDGTNADDVFDYRPGAKAQQELGVKSPLKDVRLTKQDIRELSRFLQLETAEKPAFACLATRFPYGITITKERLQQVEHAESYLFLLGVHQCRVRYHQDTARIEVEKNDMKIILAHAKEIVQQFKHLGFTFVTLDLEGYRSGSLNEVLHERQKKASRVQSRNP